jgi:phosphoglycerate dehydrogenase-like enzyme
MTRPRVLEYVRDRKAVWNLPTEQVERLAREFPGVEVLAPVDRAEAERLLPTVDILYGWLLKPDNFHLAERLRWVHTSAAGVGPLLFPDFVESDVLLTNGRGLHALAMAEHALGIMLSFARKLHMARDLQHARRWSQEGLWLEPPALAQVDGSTLGIVGLGEIGRALAVRARALGLHVLAVRRHPQAQPAPADAQWGMDRLDDLLERSDWVVLCPPLTRETQGLMSRERLARMRPGAVLINLGRGALVDEPAMVEALQAGRLAGAGLDVFAEEPLPADSPLWTLPNVIVTPHVSGLGPRYWERAVDQFATNLRHWLAGEPLANVVDKRAGY